MSDAVALDDARGPLQLDGWHLQVCEERDAATVLHEDVHDGRPDHVVMADPEGNEFCVV